jgi:hypothetical protein
MKNQAALDTIQAQLNPAHLDRLPRPHDLLASDIASHIADATRDLAATAPAALAGAVAAMVAIALAEGGAE